MAVAKEQIRQIISENNISRVPDTAHDCPILRIGVMHEQPVSERENLSKWELFSQSGKQLCTGASLWAVPKLAMGVCPLEPRHANGDNSVLEISTGYFFSDCHGLAKTLSCIYQRGTLHIPLWNPLLI